MEETITISKEHYDALVAAQKELCALNAAGVDNWDGYEYAMETFLDGEDE